MKSKIVLAVLSMTLLFVFSQQARSQALIMLLLGDKIASENFTTGINAGLSLTTLSNPDFAKARVSWSFGALLEWRLSEDVFLGVDVTFKTPAGANSMDGLWDDAEEFDTLIVDRKESLQTSYVSIPIVIKYQFGSFRALVGPQVAYLVAATDNLTGTGPDGGTLNAERSAFSRLNRWDVGFVAGLETLVTPDLGVKSIRVTLRYYQGLLDATKDTSVTSLNSGFYLTLGIPLGA
jgi:hypothetical protein